jgi:transposase-like protein
MTLDSQIRERLGRLPPTLKELYRDIYEQRSLHEIERSIISKVFSWLLCAKELLNSSELLAVVSLGTAAEEDMSEEKVLELCSNFVVLDESDKAFQFAHLSLREFLEGLPEFSTTASNALLATSCLSRIMLASNFTGSWHLLRESFPELVEKLPTWPDPDLLLDYALRYWPYHCKLADSAAQHGALRVLMQRMLLAPVTPNCPFDFWMQRLLRGWTFREWSSRNDEVIYAQLRDSLDFWHSPQFVACAFGFLDIVQAQLSTNAFEPKLLNREGLSALAVATKYGHLDLLDSLLEREKTEVTEEILVIAAKNETHGPEALSFLLRRSSRFHLTLHLVLAAISNKERATDVLSILFGEQKGFEISEAILKKVVARNHCDEAILGFLLAHGGRNSITEAVLAAAAGNRFHAVNLVTLLLDENQNLQIMENVLVAAARNEAHAMKLMASLLKENKPLHITENVLVAAAGNRAYAMNLITSLLGESDSLQITKRVIWAAAEKIDSGEETFEYLIDRKPPTPVTEDLLEGVLKYSRYNSSIDVIKLMKLLIDRIQNFGVTERIVKAAVVNHTHSYNLLKYLLDHFPDLPLSEDVLDAIVGQSGAEEKLQLLIARGRDIKVTKRLLVAAAESDREPLRTLKFLFGLDRDIVCTETFIKAVGNGRAIQVLPWLLEQGKELPVTSAVVESVLSNIYGVTEVLKFLLDLDPDGYVEITEEAMKRAVQCEEEVLDFLKSTGRPLPITTSVMRAALERRVEVKAVLILDWLTAEGGHLVVTEQDLIAAAGRWWGGAASILGWLLDYDKEAVITEAVVAAAIWDIDALTVLLERGQRIMVTELVVQAALKYRKSGTKGMLLLLTAGCETTADARIFIMREFNRQVVSMLPNSEEAFAHYGLPAAAQNT